jgi:MEDS: MEthanogen/methylotroph, DcmR Sensory domain
MKPEIARTPLHAVQFYDNHESLCTVVAEFIGEGIEAGHPAVVIARPAHRAGILAGLRRRGIDVDRLQDADELLVLDAEQTLATFLVDGLPNSVLFEARVTRMIERICRRRKDCTIWAYGEMVDVLWDAGNPVAAIVLEILWNKLVASGKVCILCGYSVGNVYKDANITDICGQHTHAFGVEAALAASGCVGDQPGG